LKKHEVQASSKRIRGRIFVRTEQVEAAARLLQGVFGLVSVSPAVSVKLGAPDRALQAINDAAVNLLKGKSFDSFRITTKRVNKDFMKTSNDVDIAVGAHIVDTLHKKVSLKRFDIELGIEIYEDALLFTGRFPCPGGIPVGMSGRVLCYIEKEDDLLAAWLMLKRGCEIVLAGNEVSLDFFSRYSDTPENMIRMENIEDLNKISEEHRCKAIVLPYALEKIKAIKTASLVLYPLVTYTEEEMIEQIKKLR
ncbi:MAG: THUMP domain-containing protein, partial [Candidatus Nanoarchaeia archaeon]